MGVIRTGKAAEQGTEGRIGQMVIDEYAAAMRGHREPVIQESRIVGSTSGTATVGVIDSLTEGAQVTESPIEGVVMTVTEGGKGVTDIQLQPGMIHITKQAGMPQATPAGPTGGRTGMTTLIEAVAKLCMTKVKTGTTGGAEPTMRTNTGQVMMIEEGIDLVACPGQTRKKGVLTLIERMASELGIDENLSVLHQYSIESIINSAAHTIPIK